MSSPSIPRVFDLEPSVTIARSEDQELGNTFLRLYMRSLMVQNPDWSFEQAQHKARNNIQGYAKDHDRDTQLAVAKMFSSHPMFRHRSGS